MPDLRFDNIDAALKILAKTFRSDRVEQLVTVAVRTDLVPGLRHRRQKIRELLTHLSERKERRMNAVFIQQCEHTLRVAHDPIGDRRVRSQPALSPSR